MFTGQIDDFVVQKDWDGLANVVAGVINSGGDVEGLKNELAAVSFPASDVVKSGNINLFFQLCVLFGQGKPDEGFALFWAVQVLGCPNCSTEYRHWLDAEAIHRFVRSGVYRGNGILGKYLDNANRLYNESFERGDYEQCGMDALLLSKVLMLYGRSQYVEAGRWLRLALNLFRNHGKDACRIANCYRHMAALYALLGDRRECMASAGEYERYLPSDSTPDRRVLMLRWMARFTPGFVLGVIARRRHGAKS